MDWGILPASQTSRRLRTGVCERERKKERKKCLLSVCPLSVAVRFCVGWTIYPPPQHQHLHPDIPDCNFLSLPHSLALDMADALLALPSSPHYFVLPSPTMSELGCLAEVSTA